MASVSVHALSRPLAVYALVLPVSFDRVGALSTFTPHENSPPTPNTFIGIRASLIRPTMAANALSGSRQRFGFATLPEHTVVGLPGTCGVMRGWELRRTGDTSFSRRECWWLVGCVIFTEISISQSFSRLNGGENASLMTHMLCFS